jgi:hypothetical protein
MERNETGFYNLTQLHNSHETIATCVVDGDIFNRFETVIEPLLRSRIWAMCENDWQNEKIAEIKCTYIDIDGQPENPLLVRIINKRVFDLVNW